MEIPKNESVMEEELQRIREEKKLRLIKMKAGYELLQQDINQAQDGVKGLRSALHSLRKIGDKTESPLKKLKNVLWNFSLEVIYRYFRRR